MAFQSKSYVFTTLFLVFLIVGVLLIIASLEKANSPKTGPLFFSDMDQARQFHRACLAANGVVGAKGTVYGVELTCHGVALGSEFEFKD